VHALNFAQEAISHRRHPFFMTSPSMIHRPARNQRWINHRPRRRHHLGKAREPRQQRVMEDAAFTEAQLRCDRLRFSQPLSGSTMSKIRSLCIGR
jgi:hypothetical protein